MVEVILISKSLSSCLIHSNSEVVVAKALYSASAEDLAIVICFLDFQVINDSPRYTQYPVVDFLLTGQLPQSASTYADFCEVDPEFVRQHERDLLNHWTVVLNGTEHTLLFNHSMKFPLLTEGWREMMDAHHVGNQRRIRVVYLGRSHFRMTILPSIVESQPYEVPAWFHGAKMPARRIPIPEWHSTHPHRRQHAYLVTLSKTYATGSFLDLKAEFAAFVKSKPCWELISIRGVTGNIFQCKVLREKTAKPTIKIGTNWRGLRVDGGHRRGQTLVFSFPDPEENSAIVEVVDI